MRVLHMIPDISVSNGVMSFICNYAKAMPSDIVFDVVYFCENSQAAKAMSNLGAAGFIKLTLPHRKIFSAAK